MKKYGYILCAHKHKVYKCRFSFLAHCVCNRCVAKTWTPLDSNWGVRTDPLNPWMKTSGLCA